MFLPDFLPSDPDAVFSLTRMFFVCAFAISIIPLCFMIVRPSAFHGDLKIDEAYTPSKFYLFCNGYAASVFHQQMVAIALLLASVIHIHLQAQTSSMDCLSRSSALCCMLAALCAMFLLQTFAGTLSLAGLRFDEATKLVESAKCIAHNRLDFLSTLKAPARLLSLSFIFLSINEIAYWTQAFPKAAAAGQSWLPEKILTLASGAFTLIVIGYTFAVWKTFMMVTRSYRTELY